MRIDKFLSNLWFWSRRDIIKNIKNWEIYINNILVKKPEEKIKLWDIIWFLNKEVIYRENVYLMLNKEKNYVSSNIDEYNYKSYRELIKDCPYYKITEVAWRLDTDTTWLMLVINNWDIIHKIISPRKDIFKTYYVKIKEKLDNNSIMKLENWVNIDDYFTKESKVKILSDNEIELSISEWKFHQVKKMLKAVNNEVLELHRLSIWEIKLWDLENWKWRYLNDVEIKYLESL